ncbi:C40 family peptidase [Paractinoplanes rhizophilus]|uniref:C40 family peptidase n=1 Tax=Paractinoplanes rhizophilus TaxID=1416877 RepID=A0ABW2HUZ1_9ACTN
MRARLNVMPCCWDSRECPGPISEATLHRPSACRALTAGAIALAVVTPALDTVEQANAAQPANPHTSEPSSRAARADDVARLDPESAFATRAQLAERASRATRTRAAGAATAAGATAAGLAGAAGLEGAAGLAGAAGFPEAAAAAGAAGAVSSTNPAGPGLRRAGGRASGVRVNVAPASGRATRITTRAARVARPDAQRQVRRLAKIRKARVARLVTRRGAAPRAQRMRLGNMTAVIAYARSQVGKTYVSGGEGPGGFDCSGFTKSAYARIGIRLPHSSTAQAARARRISRSQARPGDLVVGPGHVGIYMGRGMMIDAGNRRTGVVYRKLYSGLRVERL